MNDNESGTPFEDFLRSILGDEAAAEAARALEAQGFDPANLPPEFSDPARMKAALGQFQFLMNTTAGPVNWRVVEDSAKQAAYVSGDPSPTATEAEAARQAMTIADLWLDAVTDFASGPVTRDVWSKVAWVEHTIPTWKRICEPVALNVSRALSGALSEQFGEGAESDVALPDGMAAMLGKTQEMMPRLSAMMFSAQLARATLPYLPHADALREMMRRRRASGGPAEEILGSLMGLKMRPRQARGAAEIFTLVEADGGRDAREALWSHPDMVPSDTELATPDTFLTLRRAAAEEDADIDAALNSLLDGTLGWAEGLEPGDEAGAGSDASAPKALGSEDDDTDTRESE